MTENQLLAVVKNAVTSAMKAQNEKFDRTLTEFRQSITRLEGGDTSVQAVRKAAALPTDLDALPMEVIERVVTSLAEEAKTESQRLHIASTLLKLRHRRGPDARKPGAGKRGR